MRYFISTGESSGELVAVTLAEAITAYDPEAIFEGIGGERMRAAGFDVRCDNAGWATIGPFAAIPKLPQVAVAGLQAAAYIARTKPDLVILVDFGGFNVRIAGQLRSRYRYAGPILDCFPPGAWLDSEKTARAVSSLVVPLTAFRHQYEFYKRLELPVAYFGHPLVAQYPLRAPRPTAPERGGTVAILPGSRSAEISRHLPRLLEAFRLLQQRRPELRAIIGASDTAAERRIRVALRHPDLERVTVVSGLQAAIADADAAWIASGTAVLEAALCGVPSIALYVASPALAAYARRVLRMPYVALPNLVLDAPVVPEFLQDAATPQRLADAMEAILEDPSAQRAEFARLRSALGPDNALQSWAKFAFGLAQVGRR